MLFTTNAIGRFIGMAVVTHVHDDGFVHDLCRFESLENATNVMVRC